ncbi:hypothetical protein DRQ36_09035, partial [bacterium]
IEYTPDTLWLHGAALSGTLTVADSLGSLSEPYPFDIIIDAEPPEIIWRYPFDSVPDTFDNILFGITDSPAGVDTYSLRIVVGISDTDTVSTDYFLSHDTVRIGRGIIDIELCEFDTVTVYIDSASDLAVGCGVNILPPVSWSFEILDDDTLPPEIIGYSPHYSFSGIGFVVTAELDDRSGISEAAVLWSAGESLASSPDSISMHRVTPDIWATDGDIGPVVGDYIALCICASDSDADCDNPLDRSWGCDTFTVPLDPLGLRQISVVSGGWNPSEYGDPLCASEEFSGMVAFYNPDTVTLFADSILLVIGENFSVEPWADTALSPGDTLVVPLILFAEREGEFCDTLLVFDYRLSYPIAEDTIYARVRICEFYAGPNPITPNNDGIYDKFNIELSRSGDIEIDFYRLEGMRVATLRGTRRLYEWDGTDDAGRPQPPGIYLWVIKIDGDVYKHGTVTIAR